MKPKGGALTPAVLAGQAAHAARGSWGLSPVGWSGHSGLETGVRRCVKLLPQERKGAGPRLQQRRGATGPFY